MSFFKVLGVSFIAALFVVIVIFVMFHNGVNIDKLTHDIRDKMGVMMPIGSYVTFNEVNNSHEARSHKLCERWHVLVPDNIYHLWPCETKGTRENTEK
ncbi:hypothetical protein [Dongshaea marina]|uniref:hypothetical protein n=1 Tax=Dongshaea marina TaxID=2047966 RepID=UPI000D3E3304|nr:hypothetical protein [Dongshaea marina]